MELNSGSVGVMWIDIYVIDALGIETGGSTNKAMDFIVLTNEKFSEIGTILACDASDQSNFGSRVAIFSCHFCSNWDQETNGGDLFDCNERQIEFQNISSAASLLPLITTGSEN